MTNIYIVTIVQIKQLPRQTLQLLQDCLLVFYLGDESYPFIEYGAISRVASIRGNKGLRVVLWWLWERGTSFLRNNM